jgi:radical SAM protein with 4Fe4S-binding SPASM domain
MCGQEFSREETMETARSGRLLSMELELSRACNLRCLYCYSEAGQPDPDEMALEEVFDVIEQARELGARKIVVLGGGEPLLYPHVRRVIDRILESGLRVELFTNGTLVDAGTARYLFERRVHVVVKLNSLRSEVQDELAGYPGTSEAIMRGIESLRRAGYPGRERGMGVETVICRRNIGDIPEVWGMARREGIYPYVETMTMQGRAKEHADLAVEPYEVRELFHELSGLDREQFGIEWEPVPPLAASSCTRHLYSCTVTTQGDVLPCIGVDVACGNIRSARLASILSRSPVIRSLRNIYAEVKGPCRDCEHGGSCYGCRGNAYQITGDYLASDPTCWMCNGKARRTAK